MKQELQIRLQPEQIKDLLAGGRLIVDVEEPKPAEVVSAPIVPATGLPVRKIPETKKHNFRKSGTCADCLHFSRRYNAFRCQKKTFPGDCYLFAALYRVCDLFEPKGRNL